MSHFSRQLRCCFEPVSVVAYDRVGSWLDCLRMWGVRGPASAVPQLLPWCVDGLRSAICRPRRPKSTGGGWFIRMREYSCNHIRIHPPITIRSADV